MKRLIAALLALAVIIPLIGGNTHLATAQANGTYIVQPGDNLYRIGLKFNLRADILAQANGIVNPNMVYVGQKLIIPGGAGQTAGTSATAVSTGAADVSQAATAAAPADTPTPGSADTTTTPTPASTPEPTTYTVQAGDTLYRIAVKFNTTSFIMAQLNNLANPNVIYVGEVLQIPGRAPVKPSPTPTNTAVATAAVVYQVVTNTPAPNVTIVTNTPPPKVTANVTIVTNTPPPVGTEQANLVSNDTSTPIPTIEMPAVVVQIVTNPPPSNITASPTSVSATASSPVINTASNVGFSYAIVADTAANPNPTSIVTAVSDLGVSWVELSVSWKQYEPAKGAIDLTSLDNYITPLSGAGTKILLTVSKAPDWARSSTQEDGPPVDNNDFANFLTALTGRYVGKVAAYEIWTEPNLRHEWNGKPLSAASYVELLRVGAAAVKKVDPSALIISAGLAPTGFDDNINAISDRSFLQQALAAGLASYADAIGAHPNGWANPPDSSCCAASPGVSGWYNDRTFYFKDTLSDYRKILGQSNAGNKFIWVTQFGWGSSDGVADPNLVNQNFGYVKFTTQAQQATYDTRGFEIGKQLGYVGPMFLSNLNDCAAVGTDPSSATFEPCYESLLDATGNPRAVYSAIKAISK